jgi:hypothetical protein
MAFPSSPSTLCLRSLGVLCALCVLCGSSVPEPPPETKADACARQMEVIGRALIAYKRERGTLPAHLSDLYPRYVPAASLFHCPADPTRGSPQAVGDPTQRVWLPAEDPDLPCSYLYRASDEPVSHPLPQLGGPPPQDRDRTWREYTLAQRTNFGARVPVAAMPASPARRSGPRRTSPPEPDASRPGVPQRRSVGAGPRHDLCRARPAGARCDRRRERALTPMGPRTRGRLFLRRARSRGFAPLSSSPCGC